jgi:hypothetical protein
MHNIKSFNFMPLLLKLFLSSIKQKTNLGDLYGCLGVFIYHAVFQKSLSTSRELAAGSLIFIFDLGQNL